MRETAKTMTLRLNAAEYAHLCQQAEVTGIHLITAPGHGGIAVEWPTYLELSSAARKCGFRDGVCLWFEEDCCEQVVLRELLDRGMWTLPDRISDPVKFEEGINRIIQQYHPDYWSEREAGHTVPQTRKVREKNNLSIRPPI